MKTKNLSKNELAALCGGGDYVCSCMNEDGSFTILEGDVNDAFECAEACIAYWDAGQGEYPVD